ncbi:hypothetical protein DPMN_075907 [Dreissena polymorpha]|uniref:Uncharacterized protein n=1 Tax=Dreissena polymorpha TaxID=45954 RepID=A0A9D3YJ27_DREPO|nr:hypothetical protein DPMN_075907 [Dreissena polymorpha]
MYIDSDPSTFNFDECETTQRSQKFNKCYFWQRVLSISIKCPGVCIVSPSNGSHCEVKRDTTKAAAGEEQASSSAKIIPRLSRQSERF